VRNQVVEAGLVKVKNGCTHTQDFVEQGQGWECKALFLYLILLKTSEPLQIPSTRAQPAPKDKQKDEFMYFVLFEQFIPSLFVGLKPSYDNGAKAELKRGFYV
jgi:hypothetical protein